MTDAPKRDGRSSAHERGMTLIEMMVTLVVVMEVLGGALSFLYIQAKTNSDAFDRNDIQRSGRNAMTLLEDKLGATGLGLPRMYGIKSFAANAESCGTVNTPKLEVASRDLVRKWNLATTTGATAPFTVNLASADPSPGGAGHDKIIYAGAWMFFYQSAMSGGLGMGRLSATRALNATSFVVGDTNWSAAQTALDLGPTSTLATVSARATNIYKAQLSGFGVDCTNTAHPYLYWEDNSKRYPLASNIDMRATTAADASLSIAAGDVIGLRFRFLLDTNADGVADSTVSTLTFNADAAIATNDDVVGIEVQLRLRSDKLEQAIKDDPVFAGYRFADFLRVVPTTNINTRSDMYIYVDNSGI